MNCLCCGKAIVSTCEKNNGWHLKCIKKFFGTKEIPFIDISKESINLLATESVNKGYTVTGVQKKLSLHLSKEKQPRLTFVNYPTGYILKPQVEDFQCLPEAEDLIMRMAEITGIKTVPHALINVDGNISYITKRIDRYNKEGKQVMLAMEDFCQLEERLTQDKYKGSYERCGKVIKNYSIQEGLDLSEFYLRIVFSFVVGNSDMHLKNFSLIETEEGSGKYILSAAYDLLPVNIIMPEDEEELALTLNAKKSNINKIDFLHFSQAIGLKDNVAQRLINKVISLKEEYILMCEESLIAKSLQESLKDLIAKRIEKLK